MKHKGGNVYGSIYERKYKNGSISYTAEIQFQGQIMRRTNQDKELLKVWMDGVCEKLNSVYDDYKSRLDLKILDLRNKAYKAMIKKATPIMDAAKQYDLRNKVCANRVGIVRRDYFQTYLAADNASGLVKIGKSKDIHTRMQILGTKKVQLLAYANKDIEGYLHRVYQGKRVKGEWFNLTDEEVEEIIKTFGFETPGVLFISRGGVG